MRLQQLLQSDWVFLDIPAQSREEVLYYVAQALERAGVVSSAQDLVDHLLERERLGATVVGDEAAVPHCKLPGLKNVVVAFARTREPVLFGGEEKARLFFFVLSPRDEPMLHLQVLAEIARLLRDRAARQALLRAASIKDLLAALPPREGA